MRSSANAAKGMPDLTPYTGLIGVVIGGCIKLLGVRLTQQQQYRLEVLRDRQALRNATRGRLGETYTTVLLAAATMDAVAQRALSLWGNKEQVQALNEELRALSAELNHAGVRVLLEQQATDVNNAFNAVRQAFADFQNNYLILEPRPELPARRAAS
jgi:hypothetical protein